MATLSTETYVRKDGTSTTTYRVLIGGGNRPRRTIRLGDVSERVAEEARARIDALETAKLTGTTIDRPTAAWVEAIHDTIYEKLARVGLVEPRAPASQESAGVALGVIVERYIKSRSKLKPNTIRNYETTKRLLVEHFGQDRIVRTIHAGQAKDYREWLVSKYASATVAREIKRARQFFEYAKDCRVIDENPFAKIKAGSQKNTKRKRFIGRDVIEKVLAACPDNDWRLVVVLARYAGLRIPSELERLTWSDIDWHGQRFTLHVPKKEHLDGHETRVVPIFPEIEPYLRQAFDEAPDGSVYVLPRRFHNEGYAYAGVRRAIERASLPVWPKIFVNLRASRETELKKEYPDHVVYAWIGNTDEVALDHYLMVTDEDYVRAAGGSDVATAVEPTAGPAGQPGAGERPASGQPIYPAQYPAQSDAVPSRQEPAGLEKEPVSLAFAGDTSSSIPPRGIQRGRKKKAKATKPTSPGTKDGVSQPHGDLAELVRVLADLSPEERSALLALARGLRSPAP